MKAIVFSSMLIFFVNPSLSATSGDASNESLAEAWGVVDPVEIAEIENSQNGHHHHHGKK